MVLSYHFHDFIYEEMTLLFIAVVPGLIFGYLLSSEKKYSLSKKNLFILTTGLIYFGVIFLGYRLANFTLGLIIPTIMGTITMTTIYWFFEGKNFKLIKSLLWSLGFALILSSYTTIYEQLRPKQFYDLSIWAILPILTSIFLWQLFYPSILKKFK